MSPTKRPASPAVSTVAEMRGTRLRRLTMWVLVLLVAAVATSCAADAELDTFAPQGPWIAPKEFYGDPMQNLRQTLSVGGRTLQEARAGDMIHSLWEIIEYASSIITLYPGDVINNGTSGGTAAGAAQTRGEEDRYLKPGEVVEASIDGIGTLRMPVVAGEEPRGLTGAELPPVGNYRD